MLPRAEAQQDAVFGQWRAETTIATGQYQEPYAILLTLAPNGRFEQLIRSLRFPDRYTVKFGQFAPIGPDVYRFALYGAQPGEMPEWTARIRLVSPAEMLWQDLSVGGLLRFRRVR